MCLRRFARSAHGGLVDVGALSDSLTCDAAMARARACPRLRIAVESEVGKGSTFRISCRTGVGSHSIMAPQLVSQSQGLALVHAGAAMLPRAHRAPPVLSKQPWSLQGLGEAQVVPVPAATQAWPDSAPARRPSSSIDCGAPAPGESASGAFTVASALPGLEGAPSTAGP
jgi:hypothetical protein